MVPSPLDRIAVVRDVNRVSEWCDLRVRLNASMAKSMIVSKPCTMHHHLPPLTPGETVPEYVDIDILGKKNDLCGATSLFPEQVTNRLISWGSPGEYFNTSRYWWDVIGVFACQIWELYYPSYALWPCSQWCQLAVRLSVIFSIVNTLKFCVLYCTYKVRCKPIHPLSGAQPMPLAPVQVTHGALVAYWHSYAPPRCWTSQ